MLWLVLALTVGGAQMTPLEQMVARNVVVETEDSKCSGVILETGIVLTVFHALDVDSGIKVNGRAARIVLVRPDIDLLVLKTNTDKFPQVTFGTNVPVTTEVVQIGNPAGFQNVVSTGRVILIEGKYFFTDTLAMHGMSGAGVWDTDGNLVGLVQKMFGSIRTGGGWIVRSLNGETIIKALEGK